MSSGAAMVPRDRPENAANSVIGTAARGREINVMATKFDPKESKRLVIADLTERIVHQSE